MRKNMLVAVDTNILIDFADENEDIIDAIDLVRNRLADVELIASPTVLQELAWHKDEKPAEQIGILSQLALDNMLNWGFKPLNLIPAGHGIVERIGDELRNRGLIDENEKNDSFILAESALMGCAFLLSSDSDLRDAEPIMVAAVLEHFDVHPTLITGPRELLQRFEAK